MKKVSAYPPIRFSRRDLRLMIRVARFFDPTCKPTYRSLGLVKDGRGYLWFL